MRVPKKIFFFCIALFFCVNIFAASALSAASRLSELLNQFTTFQAQFIQKTVNGQQQVLQQGWGTVMIKRPGYFRFETQSPTHQIMIANGDMLWVYDVDLKQATQQSVANSPINPGKLLSGNTETVLKQFTVRMIPHESVLVFQLTPKTPNPDFHSIAMAFSHDKLRSIQIVDNAEQTTQFDFSAVKLNENLSPSLFQFKAPAGVDVLQ